jgi:hypothetical protein
MISLFIIGNRGEETEKRDRGEDTEGKRHRGKDRHNETERKDTGGETEERWGERDRR